MTRRLLWSVAGLLFLAVYAWLAIEVYRARSDPDGSPAWSGPHAWIVGPRADTLYDSAQEQVRLALETLNDHSLAPRERVNGYRESLLRAESLLERSLRAQPAQARALAQLAAIRWELNPRYQTNDNPPHLELVSLASEMAPTVPTVQLELGELLLKMGRVEEAAPYVARAVELNPRTSQRAIELLRDQLLDAEAVLDLLPRRPEVLAELRAPFVEDGLEQRYIEVVEGALAGNPEALSRNLLINLGTSCLVLGQPERLLAGMDRLGPLTDSALEAARLQQRSRAYLSLGQPRLALDTAREALAKNPGTLYLAQHLGDTALAAGEADTAIDAFREALGIVARGSGDPTARARLYSRIGRAEERGERPERAYDAYRMALELDPDEPHARLRIDSMKQDAGIGPDRR